MQREEAIDQESKNEIVEEEIPNGNNDGKEKIIGKKVSSKKLNRFDSLDVEALKINGRGDHRSKDGNWAEMLRLAFQSIGVVYGDLGTSPLYVLPSTFPNGVKHNDDMLGVLSLIFYTLTLLPLIKYGFIVLNATDNGDGGTFALYSLLCRHTKVGLTPSQEAEDKVVSTYSLELPNHRLQRASWLKSKLENSHLAKLCLLFTTMLGTSMLLGDGILTPCISVLSAVGGLKEATTAMTEGTIVWISVAILIFLFMIQRLGTDKVGYSFAPVLSIWFLFISIIGVYNTIKYDPSVLKAVNPKYIFDYFKRNKKEAWISLGGTILCVTGAEALFADVGHFTVKSIRISTCFVTYPAIVLAYTGQISYLRMHNKDVSDAFYKSIPEPVYWPMFVIAVLAAIIASQSLISGAFSIVQQSLALGCFPRVKVVHTSPKYEGQVYVPEINYLLMVACIAVTLGFRNTVKIGNAYGIAVVMVMVLTSVFMVLIMIIVWKTNVLLILGYVLIIGSVELVYLSAVLYKFDEGGYLPLAFAFVLMAIMYTWNFVYRRKYYYELDHKISPEEVKEIISNPVLNRVDGFAIFYSELVQGIPPIFKHYVANIPVLHSVLVFVSFKSLPISKIPTEERFLFRRVQPSDMNVFRCVVRYGYTDMRNEEEPFERILINRLKDFLTRDYVIIQEEKDRDLERETEREIEQVDRAWEGGVVHLVGENEVIASSGAGLAKKVLINYGYSFIRRNLSTADQVFDIPRKRLLKVGMTYEL